MCLINRQRGKGILGRRKHKCKGMDTGNDMGYQGTASLVWLEYKFQEREWQENEVRGSGINLIH